MSNPDNSDNKQDETKSSDSNLLNNKSTAEASSDVDHELEVLRLKRLQQVMSLKKQKVYEQKTTGSISQKIEVVLKVILTVDAYSYLRSIQQRDEEVYNRIMNELLPPEVMNEIDTLIMYYRQGMLRSGVIDLVEIQYLERQILGIDSQITIKKRHQDSTSLGSFLRKDN
jgi:DNA-binding TFAR19-related protein (PDSD5 family)